MKKDPLEFKFKDQTDCLQGKVRDGYVVAEEFLVLVCSDRISAFDVVFSETIPFKGQLLNGLATHFLKSTANEVKNWFLSSPFPHITLGKWCKAIAVEVILRSRLMGSLYRAYQKGERLFEGVRLPDGLKMWDALPTPLLMFTTKASQGHDENITLREIIDREIFSFEEGQQIIEKAWRLFHFGMLYAKQRGLILADTKYEFGRDKLGKIHLIDEIHTPDSSRYFKEKEYENYLKGGNPPVSLSKEFFREWLIRQDFMGTMADAPSIPEEIIGQIRQRYAQVFELLTGKIFIPQNHRFSSEEIEKKINEMLTRYRGES